MALLFPLVIPALVVSGGRTMAGEACFWWRRCRSFCSRWWRLAALCGWRSVAFDDQGEHEVGRGLPNNSIQPTRYARG